MIRPDTPSTEPPPLEGLPIARGADPVAEMIRNRRRQLAWHHYGGTEPPPADDAHRWGLALSGGGIRSATFCLGLLQALAANRTLQRFDLLSTVSGGGYVGGMLGKLYALADSPAQTLRVQEALAGKRAHWFFWWLRANGRYLIPSGAKDKLFAAALYLRNLLAVHMELGLVGLLAGLLLVGFDLMVWQAVDAWAYEARPSSVFFRVTAALPLWWPTPWLLVLPLLAGAVVCAAAYWRLPWALSDDGRTVKRVHWTLMLGVAASALLVLLTTPWSPWRAPASVRMDAPSITGWAAFVLTVVLALGQWHAAATAGRALRAAARRQSTGDQPSPVHLGLLRNRITEHLALCLRIALAVVALGAVDRLAWFFAFDLGTADFTRLGVGLTIAAAALRALLPKAATGMRLGRLSAASGLVLGNLLGLLLTFVLCAFWVSLVHLVAAKPLFPALNMGVGDDMPLRDFVSSWVSLGVAALPVLAYVLLTRRHFGFLNTSSLHTFYSARLVRSYLGATNARRFNRHGTPLAALDSPPADEISGSTVVEQVDRVMDGDDIAMSLYRPDAQGGPVHLINVCVNQTRDPGGRLFNRDRRGQAMVVAPGGWVRVGLGRWRQVPADSKEALTLGGWISVSGAAIAPGLGAMTRTGVAALMVFAGLRLGYWWRPPPRLMEGQMYGASATHASDTGDRREPLFSRALPKLAAILSEARGRFSGSAGDRWFLSDGGHFENTAAYQLLVQRCELIVVADCGADPDYRFGDVENLVRKARIDLGVDIHFWRPKTDAKSHCDGAFAPSLAAFGALRDLTRDSSDACLALARVTHRGEAAPSGVLILVKPNVYEGLSVDLVNFKRLNPSFPQQGTVDQDFSEAQWESYRQLGCALGQPLTPDFLQALLTEVDAWFEPDQRLPQAKPAASGQLDVVASGMSRFGEGLPLPAAPTAASAAQAAAASTLRAAGSAVVSSTLSLGAVATAGVAVWQAIDSWRTAMRTERQQQHDALFRLSRLWADLPVRSPASAAEFSQRAAAAASDTAPGPANAFEVDDARDAYAELASALVFTADTACPSGESKWFRDSALAAQILEDTVFGCTQMRWALRPQSCRVLVQASDRDLGSPLPSCLFIKLGSAQQSQRTYYGGWLFGPATAYSERHPCDPIRADIRTAEQQYLKTPDSGLVRPQSTLADSRAGCTNEAGERESAPPAPPTAPPMTSPAASMPTPTPIPMPMPVPDPAISGSTAAAPPPRSNKAAVTAQPCVGVQVFIQVYGGGSGADIDRQIRHFAQLGATVRGVEDVLATARQRGQRMPEAPTDSILRFHDATAHTCAAAFAKARPAAGDEKPADGVKGEPLATAGQRWKVEPLSNRYSPTPKTLEVWLAPAAYQPATKSAD